MKTIKNLSFAILSLCFVIGCQNPTTTETTVTITSELSDEALASIDILYEDYIKYYLSYDWSACVEFYTRDAIRFAPGSDPIKGHDAILEGMKQTEKISKYEGENVEIYGSLNYAFVWRRFSIDATLKGVRDPIVVAGNTLYVLKKVDNSWKIHRVMWNY
ncbi:YybH family protein [Bacteroidota bacterium]